MKNIVVLIGLLCVLLGYSGEVFSCTVPHRSHPGELVHADIVFKGEVVEVKHIEAPSDMVQQYEGIAVAKYKVIKTYKGPKAEFHHRLFYKMTKGQGDWGNMPSVGQEFIIGAYKWEYDREVGALNKYKAVSIPDYFCGGSYVYTPIKGPIKKNPQKPFNSVGVYEEHMEYLFRKELNLDKKYANEIKKDFLHLIERAFSSEEYFDGPGYALAYLASLRDPETLHLIISTLKYDRSYDIQHYVLNILGTLNVKEIIPVLEYFKDDHGYVYTREKAAKALAKLKQNLSSQRVIINNKSQVNDAVADFFLHKAREEVLSDSDSKARKLLKIAIAHKPALKPQEEKIWLEALLNSARHIIRKRGRKVDPKKRKEFLGRLVKRVKQIFVRLETIKDPPKSFQANAHFFRGVIYFYQSDYSRAIKEFQKAKSWQKQPVITYWLFAARIVEARKISKNKPLDGLIMTTKLLTSLPPEDRKKKGLIGNSLKSSVRFLYPFISQLYYEQASGQDRNNHLLTDCDKLSGHYLDIYKVAIGLNFGQIKADKALQACKKSLEKDPDNPRLMLNLSRAHAKAAEKAFKSGERKLAENHYKETAKLLKAAMKMNYPYAFNNMAHHKDHGIRTFWPRSLNEDGAKAAALYVQTFNRIIHCCWLSVAKHIVKQRQQHDPDAIRDILGKYTKWAVALNVKGAEEFLKDLQSSGIILKNIDSSKIEKADYSTIPIFMR